MSQPLHVEFHGKRAKRACSKCGGVRNRPGQQFCRTCHAAYMRAWRVKQRQLVQLARALVKAGKATLPPVTPAGKESPCS